MNGLAAQQRPVLQPSPQTDHSSEQALREQLLAQVQQVAATSAPLHTQQRTHAIDGVRGGSPNSPQHHHGHNIDPAIAGAMMNHSGESGGDDNGSDGKKGGKRELSTSKRAAQNRAAQRAFRQRKEGHIKKLEEQVRDYNQLSENYKALQAENYQLRDYIINLQSRLIESQGDYPQPPSNIDLPHPRSSDPNGGPHAPPSHHPHQMHPVHPQHPPVAPTAPMGSSAIGQLQAASAAQDLRGGPHVQRHIYTDPERGGVDINMKETEGMAVGVGKA
ncbi:MAG: hypothetical protein MMC33_000832 [Icmadophila ericetorum]|nr:hypothetical protein [Icmadophila ericetorum]